MNNTHIEHPEDTILTGDLSVFDVLYDEAFISMKMDGMSLVWGTNPVNGKFFVSQSRSSKCSRYEEDT